MSGKAIVDDYYSSISGEQGNPDKSAKPALKTKKKLVKKKDPIVSEEKIEEKKESIETKVEQKKPKIVQKISVVKKKKPEEKRHKIDFSKKEEKKPEEAPKKKFVVVSRAEKQEQSSSDSGFKRKKQSFKKSNIGVREQSEVEDSSKKKSKLAGGMHKTRGKVSFSGEDDAGFTRSHKVNKKKKEEKNIEDINQNLVEKTGETITLPDVLSLKEFSEKIGVVLPKLMAEFMKNGMMVNINSKIDFDTATIIAEAFEIHTKKDDSSGVHIDDIIEGDLSKLLIETHPEKLVTRSPVISIMGHVDHGKTSLLDYIRSSKTAAGEAGGITQSIGAYQAETDGGKITFLDTPGHEAFTIMRARGAKSTDIAILVVAADEGVKPQTIESINHAKEANIPVIVAINKMDKEGANPDHVKGQLSEHGLTPEDWGGDTPMVPVSAHTGFGIDELLEIILLVSEMKELKANPDRNGIATVIESHLDQKLGPVATILMNTGTLNAGDNIVCADAFGKVKVLRDYTSKSVKKVIPGEPALLVGLDKVVDGGSILQVVSSAELAKEKSNQYRDFLSSKARERSSSLDMIMSKIKSGNLKKLKIVLKADSNGSLEAIKASLEKLSTEETSITIIHSGVGNVTEGDVLMAEGSEAILVGFNVSVLDTARKSLDTSPIEFINSRIIYHITEKIEKIVTGMLDPKEVEIDLAMALVKGIFYTSKKFMIIGLGIKDNEQIENGALIRVIRKNKVIGTGKVESLKQGVEEVSKLEGPIECGIKFVGNTQVEENDQLEIYKVEIQK